MNKHCSILVPTLGRSPHLGECVRALGRAEPLELLLVIPKGMAPSSLLDEEDRRWVDRWIEVDRPGFSVANNLGIRLAQGRYIGTVNDDAVVENGWLEALLDFLESHSGTAAVQGINSSLDGSSIDGCGIGWNRWWQAIQLGHGEPLDPPGTETREPSAATEIFGVSATAAIYRREALQAVTLGSDHPEGPFDETLFAYYEDVDLAARLRAAGWSSYCVSKARARHAGSLSGRRLPYGGRRLIHGNRHLILARLLGRFFWLHWPRIAARDLIDCIRALGQGDLSGAMGILTACGRVIRYLPRYAHTGPSTVELGPWITRMSAGPG